jgi:hypothetical protein
LKAFRRYAPIVAALVGNGGVATGAAVQHTFVDDELRKLNEAADKDSNPATFSWANIRDAQYNRSGDSWSMMGKNGRFVAGKFPAEIEIRGQTYRGYLGGQCFEVDEDVVAVINCEGVLLALASPDRNRMVLHHSCSQTGLAGLLRDLWIAWKLMFLWFGGFALACGLLSTLISSERADLTCRILLVLALPVCMGVLIALVLWVRLSLFDYAPAWRTSRVLQVLGRPDLAYRDFRFAQMEADKAGRTRPTDIGTVFYALDG